MKHFTQLSTPMRHCARAVLVGVLVAPMWHMSAAQTQESTLQASAASDNEMAPLAKWAQQKAAQMSGSRKMRSTFPHSLGGIPTDPEVFERNRRFIVKRAAGDRPARLLLTEFLPPIASQGGQQSCVAWASTYYAYSYALNQSRRLNAEQQKNARFQFSPAYVYNQINDGRDGGTQVGRAFEVLRDQGATNLTQMPYDETDFKTRPAPEKKLLANKFRARRVACLFRGRSFYFGAPPTDPEIAKTFLASTRLPFVMALPIFTDFPGGTVQPDFVYSLTVDPVAANFRGAHAVTCVGYDDELKAFRIVNSWGAGWGDKGFLWVSEEFLRRWAGEGWAVAEPGGPVLRNRTLGRFVSLSPQPKTKKVSAKKTIAAQNR